MACPIHSHFTRRTGRDWSAFDNAHDVPAKGSRFKRRGETTDHWHRTQNDPGRPYRFKDAETLIEDFFNEVERVLHDRGVGLDVTRTESSRRSK